MRRTEARRPDGEVVIIFEMDAEAADSGARARAALDVARSTAEGAEDLGALARALGATNAEAQRRAVRAALELLEERT